LAFSVGKHLLSRGDVTDQIRDYERAEQNYWTERGRAVSVANSDVTGRPRVIQKGGYYVELAQIDVFRTKADRACRSYQKLLYY